MPYILKEHRPLLDAHLKEIKVLNVGELNYCITKLCNQFLNGELSYSTGNDVIGVLECAKLEFYRRVMGNFEDKKAKSNGDVYEIS